MDAEASLHVSKQGAPPPKSYSLWPAIATSSGASSRQHSRHPQGNHARMLLSGDCFLTHSSFRSCPASIREVRCADVFRCVRGRGGEGGDGLRGEGAGGRSGRGRCGNRATHAEGASVKGELTRRPAVMSTGLELRPHCGATVATAGLRRRQRTNERRRRRRKATDEEAKA